MSDLTDNIPFFGFRFHPAVGGAFLAALLLLFSKDGASTPFGNNLIPSLVVYSLGTTVLGTLHKFCAYLYLNKDLNEISEKLIPFGLRAIIYIAHFLWFFCLLLYLFCSGVL